MEIMGKIGKVIAAIVFWVFIIDWIFLDGYYNPYIGKESKPLVAKKRAAAATKTGPIEMHAIDLFEQFQADWDAARAKYKGKSVIVSGSYFSIYPDPFGHQSSINLMEHTRFGRFTIIVYCKITPTEAQNLILRYGSETTGFDTGNFLETTYLNNQTPLKLKGKVTGNVNGGKVELVNCTLL